MSGDDRAKYDRRRALQLARARTAGDLVNATAPAQRDMLERALADLDRWLAELEAGSRS